VAFHGHSSCERYILFVSKQFGMAVAQASHERIPFELANEDVSLSERSCLQLPYPGSSSLDCFLFRQQIFTLSHSSLVRTGLISPPATHLLTKIDFESFAFSSYA